LVVAEPLIAQPLSITFDDRGRMWVLQYRQFPNPNGLKAVKIDNWLRTKYEKLPEPPPKGPKGHDRISIFEDSNGDGRVELIRHFISDLNLASGMALGYGGVFVAQPPYLLFYADKDQDDLPDGDPEVLLKGFGMDDAHAFANSLTWGPDGWLYGAQGSTATADIRGIGFQQGIWRYHPRTKEFELFAEGGGNTWGIDFDQFGNLFAGGNTVEPMVHHVQGGYYVKGFGKHGPLHNPHTFGYFLPVKHHGYTGDSLTGGFVLYQGGAFPERFRGACIAPNTRHSASRWSTVEKRNSTFATRAAGDFITTSDIWFRPVDSTVGPDGSLYVADWYDYNISHSSPKNRAQWYQPSRDDGRIWRVSGRDRPSVKIEIDLAARSSAELVQRLSHSNAWYARQARRLLAERRDDSIVGELQEMLANDNQQLALQALWALYVSGGLDEETANSTLKSKHEYVRAWTVRLLGDTRRVSPRHAARLVQVAKTDPSVIVRSQLACTAKRLPADSALPILGQLVRHSEDVDDPHVPMLIWWAFEDKAISNTGDVLRMFDAPQMWQFPIVRDFLIERLARRWAAEGTDNSLLACAHLAAAAPPEHLDQLLTGLAAGLAGQKSEEANLRVVRILDSVPPARKADVQVVVLLLRAQLNSTDALKLIADDRRKTEDRVTIIRTLGETQTSDAINPLIELIRMSPENELMSAAFAALAYFDAERIATTVLAEYAEWPPATQQLAIDLLCARPSWSERLVRAVQQKQIAIEHVSPDQVRKMLAHENQALSDLATDIWGRVRAATPLEIEGRINAVTQALYRAKGDKLNGAKLFEKNCANCHKLHGKGIVLGPDLTGSERRDRNKLVHNIVDPSAEVRPQYISHVVVTKNARIVTGLMADSNDTKITLLDKENKRVVLNRDDIEEINESTQSLMPEKLLEKLTDQEIRDLIAYIQSDP
jgi:putative membrane-bound dehydrogenase-like protein